MAFRILMVIALSICCAACSTPPKKKTPVPHPQGKDLSGDVAFQSFVGRVRQAVAKRDLRMLASMMTPDFGYRLEPLGEGAGVFQYWDQNGIWNELQLVLNERFAPNGQYMVAPPQFAADPNYHGYRAGFILVNGSWKFAYFVTGLSGGN